MGGGIPTPNPDGGTTPGTGGDAGDGGAGAGDGGDGGVGSGDMSTPHNKVCITFNFNGGVISADCGPKTITVEKGALITLLEAPYKQGHTFLYWDESRYQPGNTYKVEANHTFTAVYAPDNAGSAPKPENPAHEHNALPSTGDAFTATIVALVALISGTLTCAYVGGCALYQKRNRY